MTARERGRLLWVLLHGPEELERGMVYWWPSRWEHLSEAMQDALAEAAEAPHAPRRQGPGSRGGCASCRSFAN
jgi:hypothetical protein